MATLAAIPSELVLFGFNNDCRNGSIDRSRTASRTPKVMVNYCERREMPDSVWLGVTVELPLYLSRADLLRKARGTGPKFIRAEPLLADLGSALNLSGISHVIAGGESGLHLRDLALCAVVAWQTRRAANPMQLMEITENDRVVVRARSVRNQTPHEDRDCADSLNAGASGWLRTLTRKKKGIAERGAPAMP